MIQFGPKAALPHLLGRSGAAVQTRRTRRLRHGALEVGLVLRVRNSTPWAAIQDRQIAQHQRPAARLPQRAVGQAFARSRRAAEQRIELRSRADRADQRNQRARSAQEDRCSAFAARRLARAALRLNERRRIRPGQIKQLRKESAHAGAGRAHPIQGLHVAFDGSLRPGYVEGIAWVRHGLALPRTEGLRVR